MDNQEQPQPEQQSIQIHVPNSLRAGNYANFVNMSVTQSEVVLDFIFINPNDNPKGTLASRVVLPRDMAQQLALNLRQVIDMANEVNPS